MLVNKLSGRQLLTIQLGGIFSLPMMMVGTVLAQSYGVAPAIYAILLGNLFLMFYGLISADLAIKKRKSVIAAVEDYFGAQGLPFVSLLYTLFMLGWFAIQLNLMTEGIVAVFSTPFPGMQVALNCLIGMGVTVALTSGIQSMEKIARWPLPFFIATVSYACFKLSGTSTTLPEAKPFALSALSLVIATQIGVVVDMPTYWRFSKSRRGAFWSVILLFGFFSPVIEGLGILLFSWGGQASLLGNLFLAGGLFWAVWLAGFLFLSGWTSNNTNLYSAMTNSFAFLKKWSDKKRLFCLGAAGTGIACTGILSHFETFVDGLGVLCGALGAALLTSALIEHWYQLDSRRNFLAWTLGTLTGLLSLYSGISFTGAAVLDAFMITSACVVILHIFARKKDVIFTE
ncbi:MAG: hypothetical protein HYX67_04560 [Candidatus Melainabacteria bacterium]|nr:hypothetical protein [Candidatus Melainabacteria bacterium]